VAIIIGDPRDPHVEVVVAHLATAVVLDASTLASRPYWLTEDAGEFDNLRFGADQPTRGWVRRLAPADWGAGVVSGTHAAVAHAAQLSLMAALGRTPGITWLSPLDSLLVGESKIVQAQAASRLGIRTPRTVVTNSREEAEARLGRHVVIKPLGPGQFTREDGTEAVVFATSVDLADPQFTELGPTPFLIQELIQASTHMRVVTVGDRSWVACLEAAERPLDWRSQTAAHSSFIASRQIDEPVGALATRLAGELGLGYSSQDWVKTPDDDLVLLDVNPGGQWLFLQSPIAQEVAHAIAAWLRGGPHAA
jgi:glutathione synthase/RimK-type ligase-like ATP-grasp enzyme